MTSLEEVYGHTSKADKYYWFIGLQATNTIGYYEEQRYTDQRPKQEECDRKRAITALERLGYQVTLKRAA